MKESFTKKHPIILSLAYIILLSVFASIATIVATSLKMTTIQTMFIQAGSFLLSILLAAIIMVKSKYALKEYGFCIPHGIGTAQGLTFLPLIAVEAITFIVGIDKGITPTYLIVFILLMIFAVINEEIYFRGLILKTLRVKGTKFAVIFSSVLFGLAHLGSLSLGKDIEHTLLLVAFSALFAFISAEIVVLTGSILIPIIWHFIHNIISGITAGASDKVTLIIVGVQCVILLGYAIYLWKKIKRQEGLLKCSHLDTEETINESFHSL